MIAKTSQLRPIVEGVASVCGKIFGGDDSAVGIVVGDNAIAVHSTIVGCRAIIVGGAIVCGIIVVECAIAGG